MTARSDSLQRYRVLFVDDEPRITKALNALFRRDYLVFTANSGQEALDVLQQQDIDVIVSDQRMPGMLGNELLSQVSKIFPKTMRVLLTGFTDQAAIVDSINEGEIYRFISKPWRNDELKEVVADAALASELPSAEVTQAQGNADANTATSEMADAVESLADYALLMIEHSQEIRTQIRRVGRDKKFMVYGTQNVEQAVAAGASRTAIGVAVVELSNNPIPALQAIHALKRARPDIVTIALASEYDTQIAIDLINQGQVHRYLTTPIDESRIKKAIQNAFLKHRHLKQNKSAQLRHKVDTKSGRVMSGLQSVFNRLIGTSGSPNLET